MYYMVFKGFLKLLDLVETAASGIFDVAESKFVVKIELTPFSGTDEGAYDPKLDLA